MDAELAQFVAITGAQESVAEHVLEAHCGDLNGAVSWFLESGGVGHGSGASPLAGGFGGFGGVGGAGAAAPPGPLPASAAPQSSPIEVGAALTFVH
jgi:hypothetical protein